MNLQELHFPVLDVISEVIDEPVVDPEEVRKQIEDLFRQARESNTR